jgi:hypothetical protein
MSGPGMRSHRRCEMFIETAFTISLALRQERYVDHFTLRS